MTEEGMTQPDRKESSDGLLGLFLFIGIILLVCAWSWLKSYNPLHVPQRIAVQFHDVAGLIPNSAVNVSGVRVGTVERIELRGKRDVVVHIKINSSEVVIPVGSQFVIISNGVVGARYLDIELPDPTSGAVPQPLDDRTVEIGLDPVRPEIIVNKFLSRLDEIDIDKLSDKIEGDMDKLTECTDNLSRLSHKFEPVADKTVILEDKLGLMTDDFRGTSQKLNRLIGNPNLTADLKETATKAEATAQGLKETMRSLNTTLADKPLRQEILTAVDDLHQSTVNVKQSVNAFSQMTNDKETRAYLKDILAQTRQALSQADGLLNKPGFGGDVRDTLHDTRQAVQHMDLVAQQMNQVLEKKHPLVHMLFGRPGHLIVRGKHKKDQTSSQGVQPTPVVPTDQKKANVDSIPAVTPATE